MKEPSVWRDSIHKISPYIPGKSIEDVKKNYRLDHVIRLASNENDFGPPPKAITAAKESMKDVWLYPDTTAGSLRERLAGFHGLSSSEIMAANGADEVLSLLISAYVNAGDEVIYCTPTFPAYRAATLLMDGIPVEVPMRKGWKFDLEGMLGEITEKTKMMIICNPNNPTGTTVSQHEILEFLDKVPGHVQVVMDEAYIEYVEQQDYLTGIDLYKKSYPVITVRTFSKYYGLAGLRVGYAVAAVQKLDPVLRIRAPFATNRPAIDATVHALDDQQFLQKQLKEIREGKKYLTEELVKLGYEVTQSETNFLFVHVKEDAISLFEQLLSKGFIIRPCTPWGLADYARITVGTREQNAAFIKTLQEMKGAFAD
jgi:histidinol-phosphate aminotransferase